MGPLTKKHMGWSTRLPADQMSSPTWVESKCSRNVSGKAGLAQALAAPDQHAAPPGPSEVSNRFIKTALRPDVKPGNILTEGGAEVEDAPRPCLLDLGPQVS